MHTSQTYDHYYLYKEIEDILRQYTRSFPQLCRLSSIGVSGEGRSIWLLEVTDTRTGQYEDKPAYFVEGNIHAGEVTGSMCVMYFLDLLFTNYKDPQISSLLENYTVYALPRVSPDGSEHYLTTPDYVRSVNRAYPYTDPMPGLVPQDLDGDGVIRRMRVPSPFGTWKVSPRDPRLMTLRRPDDREGIFYNVYEEGRIRDYDGLHIPAAPGPFGHDFNRNYPAGWQNEHLQRGAGSYPLCNPETKANADFLLAHPNVCSVLDMHTMGGQILYTPGCKSAKEACREDIALYKAIGAMAHEESGYPVLNVHDDYMPAGAPPTYGGFDDFCHFSIGIPAITIECWDLLQRAGIEMQYPSPAEFPPKQEEEEAYRILKWTDENLPDNGFKPWTPYRHDQLGDVEIGGIDYKYVIQNPPLPFLLQELQKHGRFMLRQLRTLPQLKFLSVDAQPLSGGLYRVRAIVANTGYLPTYIFREGLKLKSLKELTVTLDAPDCTFIEGKPSVKIGHLQGYSGIQTYYALQGPISEEEEPCSREITWIISGAPGRRLTLQCEGAHAGKTQTNLTLA